MIINFPEEFIEKAERMLPKETGFLKDMREGNVDGVIKFLKMHSEGIHPNRFFHDTHTGDIEGLTLFAQEISNAQSLLHDVKIIQTLVNYDISPAEKLAQDIGVVHREIAKLQEKEEALIARFTTEEEQGVVGSRDFRSIMHGIGHAIDDMDEDRISEITGMERDDVISCVHTSMDGEPGKEIRDLAIGRLKAAVMGQAASRLK